MYACVCVQSDRINRIIDIIEYNTWKIYGGKFFWRFGKIWTHKCTNYKTVYQSRLLHTHIICMRIVYYLTFTDYWILCMANQYNCKINVWSFLNDLCIYVGKIYLRILYDRFFFLNPMYLTTYSFQFYTNIWVICLIEMIINYRLIT